MSKKDLIENLNIELPENKVDVASDTEATTKSYSVEEYQTVLKRENDVLVELNSLKTLMNKLTNENKSLTSQLSQTKKQLDQEEITSYVPEGYVDNSNRW